MKRRKRGEIWNWSRSGGLWRQRFYEIARMMLRVTKYGAYHLRSFHTLPEKKLLYVSIAKAGNTSIKASLYSLPHQEDYRVINKEASHYGEHRRWTRIDEYADYYKFTFVRNPFDRLVSCYENKYHTDISEIGKSIQTLIFDWYLLGFLAKDRGFANFARRVCLIPDRMADKHFMNQSTCLVDKDGKILLDYVGKFENMNEDYKVLEEKFGLAPLPHYNKTKKEKQNWMDYYDLKTARKVYRRYKKDIVAFGYQDSYEELLSYLKKKQKNASRS